MAYNALHGSLILGGAGVLDLSLNIRKARALFADFASQERRALEDVGIKLHPHNALHRSMGGFALRYGLSPWIKKRRGRLMREHRGR